MTMLTQFQIKCEKAIQQAIAPLGYQLQQREVVGERKNSVHALIGNSGLQLWIYEDEAEFNGPSVDFRYEKWDYDSPDELIAKLAEDLTEVLRNGGTVSLMQRITKTWHFDLFKGRKL